MELMFDNLLFELTCKSRGYSPEFLRDIEDASHKVLANTDRFVERLRMHYENGDKVVILCDFDMDGISAGTLGYAGLAEMGFNSALFIPDPTEGYGFDEKTILRLWDTYPDVKAIVTCDVGITCFDGLKAAHGLGIDVLLTDHHTHSEVNGLPSDYVSCIVDPMVEDPETGYEHPKICGAYVLYQLLESYAHQYCTRSVCEQIHRLRVFAGMGTISDSMPLLYENRALVKDALDIAKLIYANGSDYVVNNMFGCEVYRRAFQGLYLILKGLEAAGKLKDAGSITSLFFAYYVSPMFNSVKRIGTPEDMVKAFSVFFGANPEDCVAHLISLNAKRKEVVADYYEKIQNANNLYAPYLYFSDAEAGILGLLAQKLSDDNEGRPCVVVRQDDGATSYHGSGRSPGWYLLKGRAEAAGFYVAGHNEAFGAGFKDLNDAVAYYNFVKADYEAALQNVDVDTMKITPDFVIAHDGTGDTVIDIVTFADYINEVERFGPFGAGMPEPQVLVKFKPSDGEWEVMGSMKQHLRITLDYGFRLILFNQAPIMEDMQAQDVCYVLGSLSMNVFRTMTSVQFIGNFVSPKAISQKAFEPRCISDET